MAFMASKSHLKSWGRLSSKQYARVGDGKVVIKCKSQVDAHGTTIESFKSFCLNISNLSSLYIILVQQIIYLIFDLLL